MSKPSPGSSSWDETWDDALDRLEALDSDTAYNNAELERLMRLGRLMARHMLRLPDIFMTRLKQSNSGVKSSGK